MLFRKNVTYSGEGGNEMNGLKGQKFVQISSSLSLLSCMQFYQCLTRDFQIHFAQRRTKKSNECQEYKRPPYSPLTLHQVKVAAVFVDLAGCDEQGPGYSCTV